MCSVFFPTNLSGDGSLTSSCFQGSAGQDGRMYSYTSHAHTWIHTCTVNCIFTRTYTQKVFELHCILSMCMRVYIFPAHMTVVCCRSMSVNWMLCHVHVHKASSVLTKHVCLFNSDLPPWYPSRLTAEETLSIALLLPHQCLMSDMLQVATSLSSQYEYIP